MTLTLNHRHVSLFAGADAIGIAASKLGFETVHACEAEDYQRQVLALRVPDAEISTDVRELDGAGLGEVGMMSGGFPCQDLSHAGRGAGLSGERSGLWSEFARLIAAARPRMVLIENVAVLRSRGLHVVINDLARAGYGCWWDVIPALAVGAPHLRERVWITAVAFTDMPDFEGKPVPNGTTKMPRAGASTATGIVELDPCATQKMCKAAVGAVKREDGTTWLTRIGMPLLPTPTASDDNKSPEAHMRMKARLPGGPRRSITSLAVLARNGFNSAAGNPMFPQSDVHRVWPTPERSDGLGDRVAKERGGTRPSGAKRAVILGTAVAHESSEDQRLWMTPSSRDWKDAGLGDGRLGRAQLPEAVRGSLRDDQEQSLWPTPWASANELRTTKSAPSHGNGHGTVLSGVVCDRERAEGRKPPKGTQNAGPLHPNWVEWLMGWPVGWTDLECEHPIQLDWLSEYGLPRVLRDVPFRKQRLMTIGNGLVWQVAYWWLTRSLDLLGWTVSASTGEPWQGVEAGSGVWVG